jgi:hypothetical protein
VAQGVHGGRVGVHGGRPPGHDMLGVEVQMRLDPRNSQKVFFLELFFWVSIFFGKNFFGNFLY